MPIGLLKRDFAGALAVRDVVVVLSACPQDLVPINGAAMRLSDVAVDAPD